MSAVFDDPNLVSCAGLAPVMALALAQLCGLQALVATLLSVGGPGGGNAVLKVPALVAGMVAGADSIDDMDLLRHRGMRRLFTGIRAPSTLGTFLRCFTFSHVRQLDAVAAPFLARLAGSTPLLPGAATATYVDIDDTVREVHGYKKHGGAVSRASSYPCWFWPSSPCPPPSPCGPRCSPPPAGVCTPAASRMPDVSLGSTWTACVLDLLALPVVAAVTTTRSPRPGHLDRAAEPGGPVGCSCCSSRVTALLSGVV